MFKKIISLCIFSISFVVFSQNNEGSLTGNIESTFQYLRADSLIGAELPPEKALMNTYMNAFYTNKRFKECRCAIFRC